MAHLGIDEYDSDTASRPDESGPDDQSPYEESPIDGYFAERRMPHPQQVYVENTTVAARSNAKAAGGQQENTRAHSQGELQSHSHWENHHAAIPDLDPPPPDYAAATANWSSPRSSMPRSADSARNRILSIRPFRGDLMQTEQQLPLEDSGTHDQRRASRLPDVGYLSGGAGNGLAIHPPGQYSTFSAIPSPLERPPVVGPQSMRDEASGITAQDVDEESSLLPRNGTTPRRISQTTWRRHVRPVLLVVFLFLAAAVIFIAFLASKELNGGYKNGRGWPFPGNDHDNDDSDEDKQPESSRPPNSSLPHPDTATCSFDSVYRAISFDFDQLTAFSLVESSNHRSTSMTGAIRVTLGDSDQDSDIRVWLSYATMLPWQVDGVTYIQYSNGLLLQAPLLSGTGRERPSPSPCLDLYIQVSIRPGLKLTDFEITSGNLDVYIENSPSDPEMQNNGSHVHVTNRTDITVLRGDVHAAAWSSRETYVDAVSGHTRGKFALLDVLYIRTHSGGVDIVVDPQEEDKENPRPAEFTALTNSGAVAVLFPTETYIPQRNYVTRVETASGDVRGIYILGGNTSVYSLSGSIKAELLPFYTSDNGSHLDVKSTSGLISLKVKQAHQNSSRSWSGTTNAIGSSTGAIDLEYEGWEGVFEGRSISGRIRLKGQDWRIISGRDPGPVWEYIRAKKGSDGGLVQATTHSGSITMTVGDEGR